MTAYYSKKVLDHFLHPKHMGRMDNPDGVGSTENLLCGDIMKIYIKVRDNKIQDIKFETLGCGHAISASDMICGLAKDKTLQDAKKIKFSDIADELGDLPPQKIHCTHLAETALKAAIEDYESKSKKNEKQQE